LQGLPVAGAVEGDERLGDGVFLDVEGQAGEPLGEALEAGVGEGVGAGGEQVLPVVPELGSLHKAPPVSEEVGVVLPLTSSARGGYRASTTSQEGLSIGSHQGPNLRETTDTCTR